MTGHPDHDSAVTPIQITGESIKLGQFLKLANIIESGSHAKLLLADDVVRVNGEVEARRGRQLVPSDVVDVAGTQFVVRREDLA